MESGCCICNSKDCEVYKKVKQDNEVYTLLRCKNCNLVYLDKKNLTEKRDFIKDATSDLNKKNKEKVEYWSFPNLFEKYK